MQKTDAFQDWAMINRVVLELTGVNVPKLALTRNDAEFKEVLFRQSVVLLAAFILAPLHAVAFSRLFSRNFEHALMKLSYRNLVSVDALKIGIQKLEQENKIFQPLGNVDDVLRQKLVRAKTII